MSDSFETIDKKYCEHCWPTKRRSHFILHLNYYVDKVFAAFLRPFSYLRFKSHRNQQHYSEVLFFEILAFLRIIRFLDAPDESKLYNRSLIFFREAKKRNLDIKAIKILGQYKNEFKFIYKNKSYYYEGIPLILFKKSDVEIDTKDTVKTLLKKNNIPTAPGQVFTNTTKAFNYGKKMGFPLVTKPRYGSLSQHVTCPITSERELLSALKIAKRHTPAFIVEKYIQGDLFRATVVGRNRVFVCQKDKANIVGDGHSTIETLIHLKNASSDRGTTEQRNTTLHKIPVNDALNHNLEKQGLNLNSIVPNHTKIYLHPKFVLAHGCDVINCNELVHEKNRKLFLKVAALLQSDLVGIDFICPDIRRSYETQETAILETNSLPYIDMHQFPSHGKPDPVAEIVWDIVLEKLAANEF